VAGEVVRRKMSARDRERPAARSERGERAERPAKSDRPEALEAEEADFDVPSTVKVINSFDQMKLREDLLRGVYAYGIFCPLIVVAPQLYIHEGNMNFGSRSRGSLCVLRSFKLIRIKWD
jgi:hypothetical protein